MRDVEDAAFAVVELPEQEHYAEDEKADVAGTHDNLQPFDRLHPGSRLVERGRKLLWRFEVLHHVEQQHYIHVVHGARKPVVVEIVGDELIEWRITSRIELIDSDDEAALRFEIRSEMAAAAADIEHPLPGLDDLQRFG